MRPARHLARYWPIYIFSIACFVIMFGLMP